MDRSRRLSLAVFLVFSSVFVVAKEDDGSSCLEKLLPCEPYLSLTAPPPPACCVPLKDVVREQPKCLCNLFDDEDFLKTFNLTQARALQLPKLCGINVDANVCKVILGEATAPASSPSSRGSSNIPSQPSKENGVAGRAYEFGAYGFFAPIIAFIISAF